MILYACEQQASTSLIAGAAAERAPGHIGEVLQGKLFVLQALSLRSQGLHSGITTTDCDDSTMKAMRNLG